MLEAIKYDKTRVLVLDQLKLPHTTEYIAVVTIDEAHAVIANMNVHHLSHTTLSAHYHRFAAPPPSPWSAH